MDMPVAAKAPRMGAALRKDLDEVAQVCRILALEGHDDRTLGHVALRDPDGRGAWIKRSGIALSEVLDARDFVLVDWDGKVLAGDGARHGEWPIHTEILRRRPDIRVTAHTHVTYASIFSASSAKLKPVGNSGSYFRRSPPRYTVTSELIVTREMGKGVADALGADNLVAFLRNHGVVFCGETAARCLMNGLALEKACFEQLTIGASGLPWKPPPPAEQLRKMEGNLKGGPEPNFLAYYKRKLAKVEAVFPPPADRPSLPGRR